MSADACTHPGWTTRAQARFREATTVQFQPQHLRAGRLPVVPVGEVLEAAPEVFLHVADLLGPARTQP